MSKTHSNTIYKTYQYRGYTCKTGYARIREVLRVCQRLYNRALAERIAVYKLTKKSMGFYSQTKWLSSLRKESQELSDIDVRIERGALVRLDNSFRSFFRRVKNKENPGFPRFKPYQRYTCIELTEISSSMVKNNRIKIKGLPTIHIRQILPNDKPISIRIIMRGRILTVNLIYKEKIDLLQYNNKSVGIDMGVNNRMTLSTNEVIERRKTDAKKQRILQRSISRKIKGSNSRRKAVGKYSRFKRKEQIANRNECHQITTDLVRRFGFISIEKLQIQNMTRGNRGLNRAILDVYIGLTSTNWRPVHSTLYANCCLIMSHVCSKICSRCGEVQSDLRVYSLFECFNCDHVEDRDVNAAKNILKRGRELAAQGIT